MATEFTQRLLIVVKAALQQTANEVAVVADPTTDGNTFTTPLRTDGGPNTAAAYWTSWVMTQAQRDRLIAEFGARAGAFTVYSKPATVPTNLNFWIFESATNSPNGYTPDEVLALLPLDRFASAF